MSAIWQRFTPTVCSVLLVFVFLYYVDVAYVVSLSTSQAMSTATALICSSAPMLKQSLLLLFMLPHATS